MKCQACGGENFTATFQAFVSVDFAIEDEKITPQSDVGVDGAEMNSDWLTSVCCATCGVRYDAQEGGFYDKDGNAVTNVPFAQVQSFETIAALAAKCEFNELDLTWLS